MGGGGGDSGTASRPTCGGGAEDGARAERRADVPDPVPVSVVGADEAGPLSVRPHAHPRLETGHEPPRRDPQGRLQLLPHLTS